MLRSRDLAGLGLGFGLMVVGLSLSLMKYWSRSHGMWSRDLLSRCMTPKSKLSYLASMSKAIFKFLCIWLTINVVSNLALISLGMLLTYCHYLTELKKQKQLCLADIK